MDQLQVKEADKVDLIYTDGGVLIKPLKNKTKLDKLLDGINEDNLHDEIDFGKPEGEEEW